MSAVVSVHPRIAARTDTVGRRCQSCGATIDPGEPHVEGLSDYRIPGRLEYRFCIACAGRLFGEFLEVRP